MLGHRRRRLPRSITTRRPAASPPMTAARPRRTPPRPLISSAPTASRARSARPLPGGLSVGVPGNIRLMELAHERHGRLPWARLFEPAIRLARDGFAITPRMHRDAVQPGLRWPASRPGAAPNSTRRTASRSRSAPCVRNPELAALLERIAARGPEAFYTGPDAQALVRTVRNAERNPSPMTADDLATYQAREREPVCGTYRGYRICGMGPPSSGATTVFAILKQLERFDLRALGRDNPAAWHLIAECMRLAYADRDAYLADPDFVRGAGRRADRRRLSRRALAADLARPRHAARHRRHAARRRAARRRAGRPARPAPRISSRSTAPATSPPTPRRSRASFGSGLTVNGMFLNNELTDFSFAPERDGAPVANRVEGGKRPRSSMSPTIVYGPDGQVRLAVGAAGGTTIIAQVAKAIIGVIDWDLSAQEAIALAPDHGHGRPRHRRARHQPGGDDAGARRRSATRSSSSIPATRPMRSSAWAAAGSAPPIRAARAPGSPMRRGFRYGT